MCSGVFRMTMKTIWLIAGLLILSTVASEAAPPANSTVAPGKSAAAQTRKKIDYGLVSVERVFGDDAKVNIGYASEFVILPEEGKGSALAAGFRLIVGWVRLLVQKGMPGPGQPAFKLKIFTASGTTGVRGTEFTLSQTGNATTLHVLEGSVYVGPANGKDAELKTEVKDAETVVIQGGSPSNKQNFDTEQHRENSRSRGYRDTDLAPPPEDVAASREVQ